MICLPSWSNFIISASIFRFEKSKNKNQDWFDIFISDNFIDPRKNGVRRVRISFPKEVENIIRSLSGPTMMYGLKCLVSFVGQKQKCYFCDEEGHNIAKCPIKETICEKCHQKGD
ncbi:hypothetical protein BpHYR1_048244 [Brachionus plicatilis]|uniref:CCHC-type domain-containing protein n=1 Tax=Brachionus plicatilis TaxID=10195 RepID=A0A3M7PA13_BRAPC|nr:hypothetical protein BpHYR1_048244 [Brachionus plicatilis]